MSKSQTARATAVPKRPWPAGNSEMAERIRTFDWAATPLGPIETWPQSLRTAVDICLASAFPCWIDWGRDLIQIYNDAAIATLRSKHPQALGAPARRNWADVWDITGPLVERVMATGEAVRVEDLAMMPNRGGPLEAAYFTLSLSALRNKAGRIAGLFVAAIETTDRVQAMRAQQASEQRLRRVLETEAVGVIFFDYAGMVLDANKAFLNMTGYSREDVRSGTLTWRAMTPPEWLAISQEQMAKLTATGRMGLYEKEYILKDGSRRWLQFTARDLGDGTISEYCIDIDDRKRAEAALRESEERQAFLLKLSDALRPLADPVQIEGEACKILAEHLDVDRAYFVEVDEGAGIARVQRDFVHGSAPSLAGQHRVADFAWSVAILRRGECHVIPDTQTSALVPEADRAASAALQITACMGAPLIKAGRLVGALCVTDARRRDWSDSEVNILREVGERIWAAIERARAEEALRESEAEYRSLFETMGQGYFLNEIVRDGSGRPVDFRYIELNPAFERLTGIRAEEARGKTTIEMFGAVDPSWLAAADDVIRTGKPKRVEHEVPSLGRWYEAHYYPASGGRLMGIYEDITERKRAAERMEIMVAELQHRTRNLLTVVRGLAQQTMKSSTSLEDFKAHFDDRLSALSRVQGLLSRSDREKITIGNLLRMELSALGAEAAGDRVVLAGPDVPLRNSIVQTLALAVHELATNARKHGALATQTGKLAVTWSVSTEEDGHTRRLVLKWVEQGGNPISSEAIASPRSGYGRQLIERALPYSLGAKTSLTFSASGVSCIIDLPLDRPRTAEATPYGMPGGARGSAYSRRGRRISDHERS